MKHQTKGFTLIELVVVILIIALATTAVMVSVGSNNKAKQAQAAIEQFKVVLELASDKALLEQNTLGVVFFKQSFAFMSYLPEKNHWQIIEKNSVLKQYVLNSTLHYELRLEGQLQALHKFNPEITQPHLILNTAGLVTPFQITVLDDERTAYERLSNERG